MKKSLLWLVAVVLGISMIASLSLAGCKPAGEVAATTEAATTEAATTEAAAEKPVVVGVSFAQLAVERWVKEKDYFLQMGGEQGVKVIFQDANADENVQNSQIENLVSQKVDVIIIVAQNTKTTAAALETAKKAKIPVIAYMRMIESDKVDIYVSFPVPKLGVDMATALMKVAPKGNWVIIGGGPTDVNAKLIVDGVYSVIQPAIDKGDIEVVVQQYATDWSPEEAMKITENALTKTNNKIDGILCSNDGMATGVIQALAAQKLAGKIPVTGLDADLAACQRIVEGTQYVTLYMPLKLSAKLAFAAALELAQGKKPIEINAETDNGIVKVPTIYTDTIAVTKDNIDTVIIKEGVYKVEDVYKNVPQDQWPKG